MPGYTFATWIYEQRYLHRSVRELLAGMIAPDFKNGHQFSTDFYGTKWVGKTDNYVDYQVLLRGAYEKFMLHFMRDVLKTTGRGKTVLDIGANIGNHTIFLSRCASTVHAFEPYEPFRASLEKKLAINGIDNVSVHPIGLSNVKESIPYYLTEGSATGSFQEEFSPSGEEEPIILDVDIGDDFVTRNNISEIDLVKIDTEGFEEQILTGLERTLEENRPVVIFESLRKTREASNTDFDKISAMFPDNFLFFVFTKRDKKEGKYRIAQFHDEGAIKSNDIIACPEEKARSLSRQ